MAASEPRRRAPAPAGHGSERLEAAAPSARATGDRGRSSATERVGKYFPVRGGFFSRDQKLLRAVDGVSIRVRRGETVGLVGESGCGKSTLGRLMLRLVEPTFGRVVYDGRDIVPLSAAELRPLRRKMQIIFQDPYSSLNPRMTVRDIVGEAIQIHKLARRRATRRRWSRASSARSASART